MTPSKLLIGQIVVVFVAAIGGLWFATQWAAWQLGYQTQLGAAWFSVEGHFIYRLWSLPGWWYAHDAYAPVLFNEAGSNRSSQWFSDALGTATELRAQPNYAGHRLATLWSAANSQKDNQFVASCSTDNYVETACTVLNAN